MKTLYAFALSILFSSALCAQNVYLVEQFDYPANENLVNNGWFSHSKPGINTIKVNDGGLALTQTPYIGSGIGNAAAVTNTGSNENTPFNASATSGSVYLSFLMEVRDEVDEENAGFFLHLGEYDNVSSPVFTAISNAFRARTFVAPGSSTDTYRLGLNFNAAAVPTDSTNLTDDLNIDETYLVVVKYEIVPGAANDLVSLYVFADGEDASAEPATADIGPVGGSARDLEEVQLVALRQYDSSQNIIVDGIVAQDTWDMEPEVNGFDCEALMADFGDACDANGTPGEINENCECEEVQASTLLTEQFDYPAGALIRDFGWFPHSAANTNPIQVNDFGLAWSQTEYLGSGVGNAAAVNNSGSNENRPLNNSITEGSVYASFLMEVPEEVNENNSGFFFHFGEYSNVSSPVFTNISNAFRARTFVAPGSSPDKYRLGLTFNAGAVPTDPEGLTDELDLNETYLVVVKYEIVPGAANDLVSLYVFADGDNITSEPEEPNIGPFGGTARDLEAVQLVALRQFSAEQNIIVDGIVARDAWQMEAEEPSFDCEALMADFGDECDANGTPGVINENCECGEKEIVTLFEEQFDYPEGALIRDFGWFPHSADTINPIAVTPQGLSWNQTSYSGSGIGRAAAVNNLGSNENRPFSEDVGSGSVYVSFLMTTPEEVNSSNAGFFFHLGEYSDVQNPDFGSIASAFRARTFIAPGSSPDKFKLGLNFNAAAVPTNENNLSDELDVNETYLVVVKYEVVDGPGNDLVSLYVFADGDDISEEPQTAAIGPFGGTARDLELVQLAALRQYSEDQNIIVDGMIARTGWDLEGEPIIECLADGGTLTALTPRSICVGTGTAQGIDIQVSGASGANARWGLIGPNGDVLATRVSNSLFSLDGYAPGNYQIRYIAYEDDVSLGGINNASQLANLQGCWAVSNSITIFLRSRPEGGTLTAQSPTTVCANSGSSSIILTELTGATGELSRFGIRRLSPSQGNPIVSSQTSPNFNLNGFEPGTYEVRHLSYQTGTSVSSSTEFFSDIAGCFDASNAVTVTIVNCSATIESSPNPTAGPSFVSFTNEREEYATLEVYDLSGRMVERIFNQVTNPGQKYRLQFDGSGLPNGVYLYRLTTQSETITDKFIISR